MKITAQRETLLKPLQIVSSVVERRQTSPILANTLLSVTGKVLTLTGTDLEVEMVATTEVDSDQDGDITLPARKLMDLCKTLPDGAKIEINIEKERATIRSGRSRFTLTTLPAVEYPNIEPIETPVSFRLPQHQLKQLIEQTQFAMAQQDVRYYLNGMMLEITPQHVTTVATDGHRLAYSSISCDTGVTDSRQVIVPRKGVTELQRLLEVEDTPVEIQIGKNHIRLILPSVTFTSKLIDGKFPDYQQVIPSNPGKKMVVNREQLHQVFNRIAVLSNEKFRGMRLQLESNLLRASVHNPEQEEAEEEIEVSYQGDEFEIGFNIGYFMDALSAIRSDDVQVAFTDSNHSCLVQGVKEEQSRYVIMPMRL
ncbi:MAG: DNA polymerase III subunit beta [Gammaproteobacteria bacterium]|nr:DNA polymerase III subunit beta [Gammaproteobacteria bacterium]